MASTKNLLNGVRRWVAGLFRFGGGTTQTQAHATPPSTAIPTPEELMQAAMLEAMQLTETTEDPMEHAIYNGLAVVANFLPFAMSLLAGVWISDSLTLILNLPTNQQGLYTAMSIAGEMIPPMVTLAVARSIKRSMVDSSILPLTVCTAVLLVLLCAGTTVVQYFIYVASAPHDPQTGVSSIVMGVSLFRASLTTLADIGAVLYLAVHGQKSLKRKIAQLRERAEAVQKLFELQAAIVDQSEKQRRDREDADTVRAQRDRMQAMLDRIYGMMGDGVVSVMENYLGAASNANAMNGARQQRSGYGGNGTTP